MTQQLMLEPLGIITEPNKLGRIPAGALSHAINCVIRSPGIIESAPQRPIKSTISSDGGTTAAFVITPPGQLMLAIFNRTAGWYYQWFNQTTGASVYGPTALSFTLGGVAYPQSVPTAVQPGFSYVIHGKQLLVNLYSTVIVWDTYEPTTSDEAKPRPAGLFPPWIWLVDGVPGNGTAISDGCYANYVAIYKRQAGDTLMVSAPSAALSTWAPALSGGTNYQLTFLFHGLEKVGDVLEVYRTKSKPSGGTVGVPLNYQRGEEAGSEYQRVTSVTLTAADLVASHIAVIDKTPDASLGEALYTNQAVGTLGSAAYPPPALRFMTSHKGHVFGFGTTTPPTITMRPTGGFAGQFGTDAAKSHSGIGEFHVTGCTWSVGGPPTVVTVSPTSQLQGVKIGAWAFASGGGPQGYVTAKTSTTFTIDAAAAVSGSSVLCEISDNFAIRMYSPSLWISSAYVTSWRWIAHLMSSSYGANFMLLAPSLKLPPVTSIDFEPQPTDGFTIRHKLLQDSRVTFGVSSSGETNWEPNIANILSLSATDATIEVAPRAMAWSDQNQPESWPLVNADTFARGMPCAFASTRDCIIAFYTDAIWRISGTGGSAKEGWDWRADPIATNITVCGSQAVCVLNDVVYAMTSEGLIAIDDGSNIRRISKGRLHNQMATPPWTDGPYTLNTACFLIADEEHGEILIREPSASAGRLWIYNVATDTFVHSDWHNLGGEGNSFHGDYSRTLRAPVVVGRDSFGWNIRAATSSSVETLDVSYQPVYADNPFAQRQWQSVEVAAEAENAGDHFLAHCNNLAASSGYRPLDNGRVGFEVPRNAPAIGNTMGIRLVVLQTAGFCRILGVALNYEEQTDRRRKR